MYGREDPKQDTLNDDVNELLKYLGHVNKIDHIATVSELVRRSTSAQKAFNNKNQEFDAMLSKGMDRVERYPQVLELPKGTRKVSIEL